MRPEAPLELLALAEADLRAAQVLMEDDEWTYVGFHLQQAVEKGLKAFLTARDQPLRRTHDVESLLDDAVRLEARLSSYEELCTEVTDFHTTHRYSLAASQAVGPEKLASLLEQAGSLVEELRGLIAG